MRQALASAVSLAGAINGVTLAATLLEAGTESTSNSSAFDAPDGDNTITNFSTLSSTAEANASSTGVGVALGLTLNGGASAGVSFADVTTDATANAFALNTDVGADTITNLGLIESVATSNTNATSVSVALNGAMNGLAINAALGDASSTSSANAGALSTGALADTIFSDGDLTAMATANAPSASISVQIAGANNGVSGGAAWARGDVVADANSFAVNAGSGDDVASLLGAVTSTAIADVSGASVSVGLQGAVTGVAIGGALVEATTEADARASGVNLGSGNDALENAASIVSLADADAVSTGVAVELAATGTGLSAGVSLCRNSNDSECNSRRD